MMLIPVAGELHDKDEFPEIHKKYDFVKSIDGHTYLEVKTVEELFQMFDDIVSTTDYTIEYNGCLYLRYNDGSDW